MVFCPLVQILSFTAIGTPASGPVYLPLLIPGFVVKWLFFVRKGFGKEYANGIFNGIAMSDKEKKVPFQKRHLWNYVRIQVQLWVNVVRRFVM